MPLKWAPSFIKNKNYSTLLGVSDNQSSSMLLAKLKIQNHQWQSFSQPFRQDRLLYAYVTITTLILYSFSEVGTFHSSIKYDAFTYLRSLVSICYVTFLAWSCAFYGYLLYHRTPHPIAAYIRELFIFLPQLQKQLVLYYWCSH